MAHADRREFFTTGLQVAPVHAGGMRKLLALVVCALGLVGCPRTTDPPTSTQVGAGVRDCTACVQEVAPIVTSIFARCGAVDAGADR